MSNKLLFVRHGECVANVDQVYAGSEIDSPLTGQGRRDAVRTAKGLSDEGFTIDRIVSSPLLRAYDTAKIILESLDLDLPIETDDRLRERSVGQLAGKSKGGKFTTVEAVNDEPTAERREELYNRVKSALIDLKQHGGTTLIATHNGALKAIRCAEMGLPPEKLGDMPNLENGEIFGINY
ncbi:histidine phosphatase family protein [Candidatus Saccharibacteria bacterium]|nr:histidine phosphatase family protein [Candidatus Saccharibacteria bacterium]